MTIRPTVFWRSGLKTIGILSESCSYRLLLVAGIQMDADSNDSSEERIVFFSVDHKPMKTIIVEDPVVDAFGCSSLIVDFFVGIRSAWNIRIKADIPFRFCFYDTSIF